MEGKQETQNTMTLQELEENIKVLVPDLELASKPPAVNNPFKSYLTISALDKIKIVLLCFLFPIRLLLLVVAVLFGSIWSTLFMIGCDDSQPLSGFRKVGEAGLWVFCHVVCFLCGFQNIKVKGKVSPEARVLVAAPHSSFFDGLVYAVVGRASVISRAENASIPLMGSMFLLSQPTFVRRADKKSKTNVVKEIIEKVKNKDWPPVLIFPEGTCTNRKAYINFKPGAFYPGVPVQPIIIKYPDCDDGGLDYISWTWIAPKALKLLFLALSRLHNRVEVEILSLYVPTQEEIDDPFTYARNVRDHVAHVAGSPTTDHSYEDCRLMRAAGQLNLPLEAGLVEYYKISPMIDMNCDSMIENLKKFAKIDKKHDGVIDIEEFCTYLNMPPIDEVRTIFRIYDIDKDNVIGFREYLLGSFLISKPFNSEANIATAFGLLDPGNVGFVTFNGFSNLLKRVMNVEDKFLHLMFEDMDSAKQGKANYDQFKEFCLNKPEYALLFIHFRKLNEESSSMTYKRVHLRRSSSVQEYENLSMSFV